MARSLLLAAIVLAEPCSRVLPGAEVTTLGFAGFIDGSDVLHVRPNDATWEHLFWSWPGTVVVNQQAWNPQASPVLIPTSGSFLPADLSKYGVTTTRISGRDTAFAQITQGELQLLFSDDEPGGDFYNVVVQLDEKPSLPPSPITNLQIAGYIDGTDRIVINNAGAIWEHRSWSAPTDILLNGVHWNPSNSSVLSNSGTTRFLDQLVDFRTTGIVETSGRGIAGVEVFDDRLVVHFADTQPGADFYELNLTFGHWPPDVKTGDANLDGKVSGADYTIWAANFGGIGGWLEGDFNLDGKVTGADYTLWAANFTPIGASAVIVPEPSSLLLALVGVILVIGQSRRIRIEQNALLALGASDGSLLSRVHRIIGRNSVLATVGLGGRWPAALLRLTCLGVAIAFPTSLGPVAKGEPAPIKTSLPKELVIQT